MGWAKGQEIGGTDVAERLVCAASWSSDSLPRIFGPCTFGQWNTSRHGTADKERMKFVFILDTVRSSTVQAVEAKRARYRAVVGPLSVCTSKCTGIQV